MLNTLQKYKRTLLPRREQQYFKYKKKMKLKQVYVLIAAFEVVMRVLANLSKLIETIVLNYRIPNEFATVKVDLRQFFR